LLRRCAGLSVVGALMLGSGSAAAAPAEGDAPKKAAEPEAAKKAAEPKSAKKAAEPKSAKSGKKTAEPKKGALAPGEARTFQGEALGVKLKVQAFALDNGLRVYVVEDHSIPAFAMHTAFNVGSRDEAEGRTGFAHFFEHMMFKGSKNVPEGGHFKYVLGAGGDTNAFTDADVTQYYNLMPSHYLETLLWLESDRLESLEVTKENFDNQRDAIKEERAMRYENPPYAKALLDFFSEVWAGTGYGHIAIGSEADLDAAETADVKAFFEKYYVPNNAVIAIVGDVEFDDVKAKVEKYYGDIPRGKDREAFAPVSHEQKAVSKQITDPHAQQPLYVMGWKTVPETHPDRHALELLMNILLRGESARMSKILKDEKKLVVGSVPLPATMSGGYDAGTALGAFIPAPGKTFDEIKTVVLEEVARVKKRGVSTKDLQKAKNQLEVDTVSSLATNNGRAFLIAQGAVLDSDPLYILSDLKKYQAVTTRDIKRVAEKYLTDQWLTLEIVPKQ
jgi:zinc protease